MIGFIRFLIKNLIEKKKYCSENSLQKTEITGNIKKRLRPLESYLGALENRLRSIETIIEEWIAEFGILARGKNGPYRYIDYSQKKDLLIILFRTLIDEGYDEQTIKSVKTANLVINACEAPEGASSRSASKIRKSKQITANNIKFVLSEFFRGKFSTGDVKNQNNADISTKKVEEKPVDIEPENRIVMDTSDMAETPLDEEILAELAAVGTFLEEDKDE